MPSGNGEIEAIVRSSRCARRKVSPCTWGRKRPLDVSWPRLCCRRVGGFGPGDREPQGRPQRHEMIRLSVVRAVGVANTARRAQELVNTAGLPRTL